MPSFLNRFIWNADSFSAFSKREAVEIQQLDEFPLSRGQYIQHFFELIFHSKIDIEFDFGFI